MKGEHPNQPKFPIEQIFRTPEERKILEDAAREQNKLLDANGRERMPGADQKTGKYSTAQMLHDEFYGGDPSQPLDD